MKILMISKSAYTVDVRVRREAECLSDGGHEVSVLTIDEGQSQSGGVEIIGTGNPAGLSASRRGHRSLPYRAARWFLLPEHRARAISQFQEAVRDYASRLQGRADVIHAHDFPALEPAARLARSWGSALVYDAHEYWRGMARYGRPEPFRQRKTRSRESTLAKEADRVITVSDGAAYLMERDFATPGIVVVRNTFPVTSSERLIGEPSGAVYAGRIGQGRDLETVFRSDVWDEKFQLHLMGPIDGTVDLPDFAIATESGPLTSVDKLLGEVGISLVTLSAGPINHEIALPNKLFQAVARGLPVVATNLPEIAAVVSRYGIGELYDPGDLKSFAQAVTRLRGGYHGYQSRVIEAQPDLTWPADAQNLLSVYESLR